MPINLLYLNAIVFPPGDTNAINYFHIANTHHHHHYFIASLPTTAATTVLTMSPRQSQHSLTSEDIIKDTPPVVVDNTNPLSEKPTPKDDAEDLYKPKTVKFWLVILSAIVSMFLVALDRTILATAIPRITDDFNSLGDIGWYSSGYMLTTAACQLLFGRIYRFYDLRWTFLACIAVFEIGSAICGAAPSSPVFIFGRAVAGIGAAGISTGSIMTIIPLVPLHKRPMFQCKCQKCTFDQIHPKLTFR